MGCFPCRLFPWLLIRLLQSRQSRGRRDRENKKIRVRNRAGKSTVRLCVCVLLLLLWRGFELPPFTPSIAKSFPIRTLSAVRVQREHCVKRHLLFLRELLDKQFSTNKKSEHTMCDMRHATFGEASDYQIIQSIRLLHCNVCQDKTDEDNAKS